MISQKLDKGFGFIFENHFSLEYFQKYAFAESYISSWGRAIFGCCKGENVITINGNWVVLLSAKVLISMIKC